MSTLNRLGDRLQDVEQVDYDSVAGKVAGTPRIIAQVSIIVIHGLLTILLPIDLQ